MVQKHFYEAFNLLFETVKVGLCISQKEELYRMLFRDIYLMINDDLYDNDSIRRITSGCNTIHRKAIKLLYTDNGFETLRINIEKVCLPKLANKLDFISTLNQVLNNNANIPCDIKQALAVEIHNTSNYQISRSIAGILLCLDHSDYINRKNKGSFFDVDFMRLNANSPIPKHPKYITNSPDAAVGEFIGRNDELKEIHDEIFEGCGKIVISAVGGLGKTELVKLFLKELLQTETTENNIEQIAWIPYDNNNLCLSIKQSLRLQCDLEDVWHVIQDISAEYNKRLLLVIDNIEDIENDEYLKKLSTLQCRVIVTSRQKKLFGFNKIMHLQPLKTEECRELFYTHYQFTERDNKTLNDIIELTAKLTIMIVFIAKVAHLEEMSLFELYRTLVEKGFKLSEEDVSCEHEKMQNDETIIKQMCILFSLVKYSETDKTILTYISVIPNLQFDFSKAKRWFKINKNSSLMKLYNMGMLEHITNERTHIYWMHSVIAAAIREQQKDKLYSLSRPFIDILTEEMDTGLLLGKEYEKSYLIPFSWSIADILENHWCQETDTDFLTSLFHICFACSNYSLCETLIDIIIEIQKRNDNIPYMNLVYSYRNKIDLLLQFDRAEEATPIFSMVEELFDKNNSAKEERAALNSQYGILYQIRGDYGTSRIYFEKCIKDAENTHDETRNKSLSTAFSNMARMLVDAGDFFEAYDYIKRAIDAENDDDMDSDLIICYSTLAAICTELMGAGFGTTYFQEASDAFEKVIKFREEKLGKHHADTAVAYHDYSYFWYLCGVYDEALKYNEKASNIDEELFSEYSITRMRSLNTKALIVWEQGDHSEADDIFEYIIDVSEKMSDDYLVDVADFTFNYARCLHDQFDDEKSKKMYKKCISIWSRMSSAGNRKISLSHQEYADILFSEGNIADALENYKKSLEYNSEDFYLEIDVMDSIGACLVLSNRTDEAIEKFIDLLKLLTEYNITDDETKFKLCNNLLCIIDANSEEEKELKSMLIERIGNDKNVLGYVNNFVTNFEKNNTSVITVN